MEILLPMLGGFGIWHLLTSVCKLFTSSKLNNKKQRYEEKKENYIGLIDVIRIAGINPSKENSKNFAFIQAKIDILGSEKVSQSVQEYIEILYPKKEPLTREEEAFDKMLKAMKRDLAI